MSRNDPRAPPKSDMHRFEDVVETLCDRLVAAIESLKKPAFTSKADFGVLMQLSCEERVILATELCAGTSEKVGHR